jgi:NRPS condensation-like uncharacterized protein
MIKEMQVRDPYDTPQWRLFLKPNYSPDRSLFIIKIHHSLCDGQGLVSFLSRVSDETVNFLPPNVRNPRIIEKMLMYSALPMSLLKVAYLFLFNPPDQNPIANRKMCSGQKIGRFAKDYSVNAIKKKCKEFGVTFNDILLATISLTIK